MKEHLVLYIWIPIVGWIIGNHILKAINRIHEKLSNMEERLNSKLRSIDEKVSYIEDSN